MRIFSNRAVGAGVVGAALFIGLFACGTAGAQVKHDMTIYVRNNGGDEDTLRFGVQSGATFGIDEQLGEIEYPPFPPEELFESRFVNIPGHTGEPNLGQGAKTDYRGWRAPEQIDTFRVRFQSGAPGFPVTITWSAVPPNFADQLQLRAGAETIDMKTTTTATLTSDEVTSVTIFKIGAPAISGVEDRDWAALRGFSVMQSSPNPVRRSEGAIIRYDIPQAARVQVTLHNVLGVRVLTLIDGARHAGQHTAELRTEALEPGTYYYTVTAGEFTATRSIIVLD